MKEFTYINVDGIEEKVVTGDYGTSGPSVEIYADDGYREGEYESVAILVEDIPKLIEALSAAYNYHKE